ncbi:MAG: SURF2 Surfeit locus protein 2 [Eggerthellaceae bacterium]|nr:SURF2 Surfeit locus protein 2 [Eggerthellaceae bacterium]
MTQDEEKISEQQTDDDVVISVTKGKAKVASAPKPEPEPAPEPKPAAQKPQTSKKRPKEEYRPTTLEDLEDQPMSGMQKGVLIFLAVFFVGALLYYFGYYLNVFGLF